MADKQKFDTALDAAYSARYSKKVLQEALKPLTRRERAMILKLAGIPINDVWLGVAPRICDNDNPPRYASDEPF